MDDTISRLAVIQIIEKMRARIGHNLERAVGRAMIEILDEVGEDVGKLPSAEPKRGKWIDKLEETRESLSYCNLCGYPVSYFYKTNFCPNCGAEMEGTDG